MSEVIPKRDPVATARTLERWLGERLQCDSVAVSDLSIPKAGFSNETIVGHAAWTDDGGARQLDFVLRIEPTAHQLFVHPDALRQAQVMSVLAGKVPVPEVLFTESDVDVLGAPFFLMTRVDGRIPTDVPCWHQEGWVTELDPGRRRTLHDNALTELARLHAVDTADPSFDFLEFGPTDLGETALARYVAHLQTWYEWTAPVRRHGAEVIDEAMAYVLSEMPDDDRRGVVWGDARVGNMIFADDLSVVAMLDWEGATLGPPEIDAYWFVMFDEFLCEAQGGTRLEGVQDRHATLERYSELSGTTLRDGKYYEVVNGLTLALINSRLAQLLIDTVGISERRAAEVVTRVTKLTKRALDLS